MAKERCAVIFVGLGPYTVESFYFAADQETFWTYFAGKESFSTRTIVRGTEHVMTNESL